MDGERHQLPEALGRRRQRLSVEGGLFRLDVVEMPIEGHGAIPSDRRKAASSPAMNFGSPFQKGTVPGGVAGW